MQMRRPALCRFWLAALVHAACDGTDSNTCGAITATLHLMRFIYTYTTAALPRHLAGRLGADNKLPLSGTIAARENLASNHLGILLYEEMKLMARVERHLPGPPGISPANMAASRDNLSVALLHMLTHANEDDPKLAMSPPNFTVLPGTLESAPNIKAQSHVRGLGLVTCAFGPLHARAVCAHLLTQWQQPQLWLERDPADVVTHLQMGADPRSHSNGPSVPQVGFTEAHAAGRKRLRNALRKAPKVPPTDQRIVLVTQNLMLPHELHDYCVKYLVPLGGTPMQAKSVSTGEAALMTRCDGAYARLLERAQQSPKVLADAIESFHTLALEVVQQE